jgi:Amt family ammonium transporter
MSGGFLLLAERVGREYRLTTVKGAPRVLSTVIAWPAWLNSGDNTWQLTAATFVGLMSLPALAVLYAGLVQRKWVVNTLLMIFSGFSAVLVVWLLWAYNMGFSSPEVVHGVTQYGASLFGAHGTGFFANFIGDPLPVGSHFGLQNQATSAANTLLPFHFPNATLFYFQFVFAAITPLLFCGSILGRMKFKAWLLFVPLWTTFVYAVNAKLLWGGGFLADKGAVDFSGGYVIHMSAGVSGFVAAAIVGPRLLRDRQHAVPNNLMMVAVGAGILWLGWNGFNGGDPYYAGTDAAAAVVNTNVATACGLLTWILMDWWFTAQKKPTFLGAINGMICGLVGITPSAGWVDGYGAIIVGVLCSTLVWVAWNYLPKIRPFSKVDDALGVVYTHGMAGLLGGLLVGVLADPGMIEYGVSGKNFGGTGSFTVGGWFYTHHFHQLWEQFLAAVWVICWSAAVTAILLMIVKFVCRGLREKDEVLEIGDLAFHDEEAYPQETFAERVGALSGGSE